MTDTLQDHCTVDDIDGSFVPRQVGDVMEVEVDDELIVVGGPLNQAHALNPSATLVWRCFDGEGTIDELVADLAEATGVDPAVIRSDVLDLARELGDAGLLDGVEPTPPEDERTALDTPDPLEQGATLDPFTLPDLEGRDRSLSDMLSTPLLLVNWSPWCGFCVRIAGELAELKGTLAEQGVGLALVTTGDAEENLEVFREAGLDAPTFLKQEGIDPFQGFGTPAAYYLDAEGRVAAPFAYGSGEVPALARELAGVAEAPASALPAHDHDHDHDAEGEADTGPKYLPTSDAVCGPGGSGMSANKTSWLGTRAYVLAGYTIGVRHNSEATAEILDRLFAASVVDDPDVPDNYSVALYPPGSGRSRELNLLVRLGQQLVRSRSAERVLRALLAHMSVDLLPPREDLLYLDATPAIQDGRGILLPPAVVGWIKQLQPRLAKLGIQLVDNPFATVDARTGELVVAEPAIEHDAAVLDEVDHDVRLGSELPMVRPGRYPLSRWYFVVEEGQEGDLPRARAVAAGVGLILGRPDIRGAVDELMDVVSVADRKGIVFDGPEELADRLAETA